MNDSTSTSATGKGNMIWGILMLICGLLAITIPLASGIGVAIVIGWLLLVSGVWHLLFGFRSGSGIGGFFWQLLLAIVYGAAGLMILLYPLAGLAWLTLVLATFLLIEAALEFVLYFNIRGRVSAGWVLVDAFITLLLGILIWARWPVSSDWAIGTLIGVSLIFSGISRLMLSSSATRAPATA
ncbi:MAG: hypothetical protein DME45_09705 [Verrucomicrobia bacterium]|nr:MAG: hypothetical protein DME45_09705 [Verrucomicrobiota bacterium]